MSSLFTVLAEREADARAHAEDLREQIGKLAEQPTTAETELSRLVITRETVHALGYSEEAEADPAGLPGDPGGSTPGWA